MSKLDLVQRLFGDLPYMKHEHALLLRDLIEENDARDILEIGFYQGKSSAYIGAILDDLGRGKLVTIDRKSAKKKSPNIHDVLGATDLAAWVEPLFCFRSYTWELQKLISATPRPQFDLCYFDGGHTWDDTGFGVLLVDMLLRPGGILLLDDMDWSIDTSAYHRENARTMARYSEDERRAKPVRLVWDTILPHLGYEHEREFERQRWGVARKPRARAG